MKENELEAGSPIEINEVELKQNIFFLLKSNFIEMPKFKLPNYAQLALKATSDEDILNKISEKLLYKTSINIFPLVIENELDYSETEQENSSEEEHQAALRRIKLMLVLKKITLQDNTEVNNKDVDNRIKLIANENNVQPKEIKDYLMANGKLRHLSNSLLAEQVLAYIVEINKQLPKTASSRKTVMLLILLKSNYPAG